MTCGEEKLSLGKTAPYFLIVCLIRSSRSGKEKDRPTAASSFPSSSAERELSAGLERTEVNTAEDRIYSQPIRVFRYENAIRVEAFLESLIQRTDDGRCDADGGEFWIP